MTAAALLQMLMGSLQRSLHPRLDLGEKTQVKGMRREEKKGEKKV